MNRYEPLSWALLRAPVLPIDDYIFLSRGASTSRGAALDLAASNPAAHRAVLSGTDSLLNHIADTDPKRRDRAEGKLLRYLIRASTRATPFGALAGVAVVDFGDTTDIRLAGEQTYSAADLHWLDSFLDGVAQRYSHEPTLRVRSTEPLLIAGGRVSRCSFGSGHQAPSIKATRMVLATLTFAAAGVSRSDLIAYLGQLASQASAPENIVRFVDELVAKGFLCPTCRPTTLSTNPLNDAIEALITTGIAEPESQLLGALAESVRGCNESSSSSGLAGARRLARDISGERARFPIRTDLVWNLTGGQLSRLVGLEVARAADLLVKISPYPTGSPTMIRFHQMFLERYGQWQEVPLLQLVDRDFGLDIDACVAPSDWSLRADRDRTLQRLAQRALTYGLTEIELTSELIEQLITTQDAYGPDTAELPVTVVADTASELDAGRFHLIIGGNVGAYAAGMHLGRFATALGKRGEQALREAATVQASYDTGAIWADLAFRPPLPRSKNVVVRPPMSRYQLVFEDAPSRDAQCIPFRELRVGSTGTRFYLKWAEADRDVRVLATHVYNLHLSPPVCQFVQQIGLQQVSNFVGWDWGSSACAPALPRIRFGRTILAPRRWNIDDIPTQALHCTTSLMEWLERWRAKWNVPANVSIGSYDHRLNLNLNDVDHVCELRRELISDRRDQAVVLEEAFLDSRWLKSSRGRHVAEVVVPLKRRVHDENRPPAGLARRDFRSEPAKWRRPLGSDWLFAKLYGPSPLASLVIADHLLDFCERWVHDRGVERWHFLRYADPNPHIRLRLQGNRESLLSELLPALVTLLQQLVEGEMLSSVSFDTYEREVARYGGSEHISACEDFFWADSFLCATLLRKARSERWDLFDASLLAVDRMLRALGLEGPARLQWYQRRSPGRDFVGQAFRSNQKHYRLVIRGEETPWAPIVDEVIQTRLGTFRRPVRALLNDPLILDSLMHMHFNRLFGDRTIETRAIAILKRTAHSRAFISQNESPDDEIEA